MQPSKGNFPQFLIKMSTVGEATGTLKDVLENMAKYYEKRNKTAKAIKGALFMPVVYLVLTFLVAIALMLFVIPNFQSMFDSLGGDLPLATQIFIAMSDFVKTNALYILLGIILVITLFSLGMKKNKSFKNTINTMILKMPKFGLLVRLSVMTNILNTLSQLLENSIRTQDALKITRDTIDSYTYQKILTECLENVENGMKMSYAFDNHWAVEPVVPKMISIGEKSGEINTMLENLANFYSDNVDSQVEMLKKTVEPVLLMLVYGVIGIMMFAILMPMLTVMENA